jgi:hypothetical protein
VSHSSISPGHYSQRRHHGRPYSWLSWSSRSPDRSPNLVLSICTVQHIECPLLLHSLYGLADDFGVCQSIEDHLVRLLASEIRLCHPASRDQSRMSATPCLRTRQHLANIASTNAHPLYFCAKSREWNTKCQPHCDEFDARSLDMEVA